MKGIVYGVALIAFGFAKALEGAGEVYARLRYPHIPATKHDHRADCPVHKR